MIVVVARSSTSAVWLVIAAFQRQTTSPSINLAPLPLLPLPDLPLENIHLVNKDRAWLCVLAGVRRLSQKSQRGKRGCIQILVCPWVLMTVNS